MTRRVKHLSSAPKGDFVACGIISTSSVGESDWADVTCTNCVNTERFDLVRTVWETSRALDAARLDQQADVEAASAAYKEAWAVCARFNQRLVPDIRVSRIYTKRGPKQ